MITPVKQKVTVAIDSQKLDAIQSCMYQYKLKFGTKDFSGSTPLIVPDYFERGGLLHHLLEPYYKLKKYRQRWHLNNKNHNDIVQICINIGRYKASKMQLDIAEIETVIDTFCQYVEHWENDGWYNIVAVENVGCKTLYEDDDLCILYEFKIDLILLLDGLLTPVDHKSSKSRRDPNQLSNQFKGYCWALDVHTILVNEIGFQRTLSASDKFRRHTIHYSASVLKEWVENTVWWVKHALGLIENEEYPKNFTSCDKYSGCIFKPICIADPEVREYKLQTLFGEKTWDVGKDNL